MPVVIEGKRLSSIAVAVAATLWAVTLVVAPSLSRPAPAITALVYAVGAVVCHQRPERSFHVEEVQLPVCARCLGLYAGGALGAVLWMLFAGRVALSRHRAIALLVVLGLPTAISVLTSLAGWWDPPNLLRAAMAVPLGAAAGLVVSAGLSGYLK